MSTLADYLAEQLKDPRFAAAWERTQRKERRYPQHIPVRRVSPTRSRWFCWACGLRLPKRNLDALCRVRRNQYRREAAALCPSAAAT